jgi:hypothetical protein
VGDQDDSGAPVAIELLKKLEDSTAGGGVEIAGRFVGEKNLRGIGERSGNRDALLLAAGQLSREVVAAGAESNAGDQISCSLGGAGGSSQLQRDLHILQSRKGRNQLKRLEDEADFFPAQPRALVLVQLAEVRVVEDHRASRWCIKTSEQAEQGGLSAPRRSDDCDERSLRNGERNVAKDCNGVISALIFFRYFTGNEHERAE